MERQEVSIEIYPGTMAEIVIIEDRKCIFDMTDEEMERRLKFNHSKAAKEFLESFSDNVCDYFLEELKRHIENILQKGIIK